MTVCCSWGGLRVWPLLRGSADMGVSCPPQSSVSSLCSPRPQDCTICMERLVTASGYEGVLRHKGVRPELVGRLGRCGHMYHLLCLVAMYSNGNKVGWWGGLAGSSRRAEEGPRHLGTSQPHPLPAPGWQPAVPHLQGHLWGEDGHSAAREDGVSPHPSLAARFR